MSKLVDDLRRLMACEPGCEGRCDRCPDTVGREAADRIEDLESVVRQYSELVAEIGAEVADLKSALSCAAEAASS